MKKVVFIILAILSPAVCFATVSITGLSGMATNGSTITISGSGFEAKSVALPVFWADFSEGTTNPHSSLSRITSWADVDGTLSNAHMIYDADEGPDGSGVLKSNPSYRPTSANTWWTIAINPGSELGIVLNDLSQKFYVFREIKRNFVTGVAPNNWKDFRIWTTTSNTLIYVGWQGTEWAFIATNGYCPDATNTNITYTENTDTDWRTVEQVIQANTVSGTQNGIFKRYVNNVLFGDASIMIRGESGNCSDDANNIYVVHEEPANWDGIDSDDNVWLDDIYVDGTWQRIIIGDASTYAACTHLEIQIPTAWADGSISAVLNRGSFGASEGAYLYVFDTTGTPNSTGYPISFGNNYSSTPSSADGMTIGGGAHSVAVGGGNLTLTVAQ